jgi:hypothetical protein
MNAGGRSLPAIPQGLAAGPRFHEQAIRPRESNGGIDSGRLAHRQRFASLCVVRVTIFLSGLLNKRECENVRNTRLPDYS